VAASGRPREIGANEGNAERKSKAAAKTAAERAKRRASAASERLVRQRASNYERYLALAQAATQNGDIIEAENWYQHAEHYFRVMREGAN
jgi:cytochrome c-type biogenesis protein CcmH/NrfG